VACPGYFRTLGVRVLEGREFTGQDTTAAPGVVLINEALAKEYWPNEDPVGKRISITADGPGHWLTIVGVVGNVRHWGLSQKVRGQLFRPYTQAAWPWLHVVARTATAPAAFVQQIKQAMATIEPDRPVASVRTMEDVVRGSVGSRRFPMLMLAAFACLALVLAAVGIIGVVSFAVTQRIHEIGIRVALGAQQRHVIWMMVRGSMSWVLLGVAAGSAASLLVSRLLSGLLYEVTPGDPTVLAAVVVTLSLVALAASWVPARRATKVDPLVALRSE
jgi:predicted permease